MGKTKRFLLSAFVFLSVANAAYAEKCVVVELSDNTRTEYLLGDHPSITFDGTLVTITTEKGTQVQMSCEQVQKVYLAEASLNAISPKLRPAVRIAIADKGLSFSGLTTGSRVAVSTVDGRTLASGNADHQGMLTLPLNQQQRGVIIVNTNNQTFKIIKK